MFFKNFGNLYLSFDYFIDSNYHESKSRLRIHGIPINVLSYTSSLSQNIIYIKKQFYTSV